MALEIPTISDDAGKLTQSLVQVMQVLDLYQAEVARILKLQCGDVDRLSQGHEFLQLHSSPWKLTKEFIRFYQLLYQYHQGQGVAMRNWLRRRHVEFDQTPHLMLVDEGRLQEISAWLEAHQPNES